MAKLRTPKPTGPRRKDESAYYRAIRQDILNPLFERVKRKLATVPPIAAAWKNAVNLEFERFVAAPTFGVATASVALDNIRAAHKAQMIKSFQAALGIDITPMMSDLAIRPIMNQALLDNIALIKSIPEELNLQIVSSFDKIVFEKGFDQQAMVQTLEKRFKVANNRARFIARDQTEKIVGRLNEARQTDLGIKSYIWQTSEDERVVGTPGGAYPDPSPGHGDHYSRNQKEFLWKIPPHDGHPGEAFNCRCIAIPVIPELQQSEERAAA